MSILSKTKCLYAMYFILGTVAGLGIKCAYDSAFTRQLDVDARHEEYYRRLEQGDLADGAFTEWLYEVEREMSKEEIGRLVGLLRKKLQTMHLAHAGLTASNQNDFIERVTRAVKLLETETRRSIGK